MTATAFVTGLIVGFICAALGGLAAWRRERENVRHAQRSFRAYLVSEPPGKDGTLS